MVKQTVKEWIAQEQGKHFCQCGCGEEIKILREYHGKRGIPDFLRGHQNNKGIKEWCEQEQGKHICNCGCGNEIKILPRHHSEEGIPKFIKNHSVIINPPMKNKKHSEKSKKKMSEWHIGKKVSKETKRKISKYNKGKKHSKESIEKGIESRKGFKHTLKSKLKISQSLKGKVKELSRNWQGGLSYGEYCYKFNEQCKESNRAKFNNQCFLCGLLEENNIMKSGKQRNLSVHHTDSDKEQGCNDKKWNLVPLCNSCHGKMHGKINRDYYELLLSNLLYIREMIFEYEGNIDYRSIL